MREILVPIIIISVTLVMGIMANRFILPRLQRLAEKTGIFPVTSIFANLIRFTIFTIGVLIILQTYGISITPILTALGVGGLAVALALQETLSNLFAGLHILVSKMVRPGDYIKINSGEEGYVQDITWRNTSIRMLSNNMIIVPNSKLASSIVTNFYAPETELAVLIDLGVSYASDLEKVERVTMEVGKEVMRDVQGGVPKFDPFIRYHTFADFSIKFTVILRGKEFVDQYLIKHEFVKRLHARYEQEGIEIPVVIKMVQPAKKEG
ncbi:MAG: mechanosensitive ion channel family protein [Deltaproteobacteria bacterium]|nr:mechanosensitive ion channel family protein [Deltaproteobacteria bacterium]